MPQIINTNIASLNAQRNLNSSQRAGDTALERLSSGLRINSAKDDAAGLAISTRFGVQISGTQVAIRNAGDGISLAQTGESALSSITDSLSRIRELALQSANDTNSDVDRAALQQEVEQLVDEIRNVADTTNFNGKKLLDGSFQNSVFQTGANVGDTINVSISQLDAETLGSAETAGISSRTTVSAVTSSATSELAAGDLVINGISVGASVGSDDDSSTYQAASSAIAKAAAINEVSDQTGVTAVVDENTAAGTIANYDSTASGTININGVDVNLQNSSTLSASLNLQAVADAINLKSDATGVTATFVSTTQGVSLTAADGRNIVLTTSTAGGSTNSADDFGLADSRTSNGNAYVGTFTLVSDDGSDINITTDTGNIDNAGFEEGVYSGINGGVVGDANTDTTRAALTNGDLVINGVSIGATQAEDDTASTLSESASGIALAAAINRVADETGVSATVNENNVYSAAITAAAGSTSSLTINGVSFSYAATGDTATDLEGVIDAINAKSGQTGVTATALDSDQYTLTAADGRNIVLTGGSTVGLTADTYISAVTLESGGAFELSSDTGNIARSGFRIGEFGGAETGTKLDDLDISTVAGANAAVTAVDNALQAITSKQAELGAIQNRFQNTIANLESLNENLSAANSRILDADFAAETASLSRAQVLQQAGISILAQANARPQQVLSLLQ
ncbi:flagellin [Hahella ganghwensis]|uniref:flagellin N-terminal helical domain-containing protein n=1 Tax=Hahella ganghwensis TaxID=286420 RepID=UPI00036398AC|nr:flagellin [Hahella ganghwensis]